MLFRRTRPTLADHLLRAGKIDDEQAAAVKEAAAAGEPQCLALLHLGFLSERKLLAALAERLEVPVIGLESLGMDESVHAAMPEAIAGREDLWPMKKIGSALTVAMADPGDENLIKELEQKTGLKVRPMLAPVSALREMHRKRDALRRLHQNVGDNREFACYVSFFERLEEYRFESVLGSGGFGLVCRCWQSSLQRPVAVKVLNPEWNPIAQVAERFKREGRIIARLDHPNIIRVFEQGEREGFGFIAMEYFEGQPLDRHLAGKEWGRKLSVLLQVCLALDYAHKQGVIHRDIKPANILANSQGAIKLLDFGVARGGNEESSGLTSARIVLGTPKYMAPELSRGAEHSGPVTDAYAFGVMAYEILGGRRFDSNQPIHPTRSNGSIPRFLGDLILQCVSPDPRKRPAEIQRVAQVLQQAVDQMLFGEATKQRQLDDTVPRKSRLQAVESNIEPRGTLREEPRCRTQRAFNRQLGREVVIKLMERPDGEDRLNAYADLRDFHIGELFGVGRHGKMVLTVCEYLPGGSLAALIGREQKPARVVEILRGIISALHYAQVAGLVHGNLHPNNILFTEAGAVKVVDFGLRVELRPEFARFRAPAALGDATARDRHALGAIAYELICGEPFPGGLSYAKYFAPLGADRKTHPLMKYFLGRLWRTREQDPPYEHYQSMLDDLERIQHRLACQPDWTGGETAEAEANHSNSAGSGNGKKSWLRRKLPAVAGILGQ